MLAYTDRTFGANGFYTSAFPDQWESIQTTLASLSHTFEEDNFTLNTRAYWRQNVDEFRLKRFEPAFFQNNHTTDVIALEANEYGWKHFPGTEIGVQATPNLRFYSGYGISYRIPTYTDLYYKGPTNIGNDQLLPEQAGNFEVGTKWNKNGFWAEMVYFIRKTDNLIEWTRPNDSSPWQPQNFTERKKDTVEGTDAFA
ncbi:hypothetical protein GHT06_003713 [Daphnia sinensis]|uniref:TonB-dependent receptor-like beta-barrel domain-containing protein n=1 Tax=Daphnia sinensis TaxID=1820382 RepID=A0AAD5PKL0_9CRUS|nr:hypothetical protein GHT06_003713 [Daphnia sinensis]